MKHRHWKWIARNFRSSKRYRGVKHLADKETNKVVDKQFEIIEKSGFLGSLKENAVNWNWFWRIIEAPLFLKILQGVTFVFFVLYFLQCVSCQVNISVGE